MITCFMKITSGEDMIDPTKELYCRLHFDIQEIHGKTSHEKVIKSYILPPLERLDLEIPIKKTGTNSTFDTIFSNFTFDSSFGSNFHENSILESNISGLPYERMKHILEIISEASKQKLEEADRSYTISIADTSEEADDWVNLSYTNPNTSSMIGRVVHVYEKLPIYLCLMEIRYGFIGDDGFNNIYEEKLHQYLTENGLKVLNEFLDSEITLYNGERITPFRKYYLENPDESTKSRIQGLPLYSDIYKVPTTCALGMFVLGEENKGILTEEEKVLIVEETENRPESIKRKIREKLEEYKVKRIANFKQMLVNIMHMEDTQSITQQIEEMTNNNDFSRILEVFSNRITPIPSERKIQARDYLNKLIRMPVSDQLLEEINDFTKV